MFAAAWSRRVRHQRFYDLSKTFHDEAVELVCSVRLLCRCDGVIVVRAPRDCTPREAQGANPERVFFGSLPVVPARMPDSPHRHVDHNDRSNMTGRTLLGNAADRVGGLLASHAFAWSTGRFHAATNHQDRPMGTTTKKKEPQS